MIDKTSILNHVKGTLSIVNRRRANHINRSFSLAVIDLANKFLEQERMVMKETDVASGARTVVLTGMECDVRHIYYIRYGTGETQSLLTYIPFSEFIKKYSNPSASAGTPSYYTFLGLDEDQQEPEIKFNVPAESATTMEVYYFKEIDPNLLRNAQGPALNNCTLAYFFGIGTPEGGGFYSAYRINIADVRATGKRVVDRESKFIQNTTDENIAVIRQNLRDDRA